MNLRLWRRRAKRIARRITRRHGRFLVQLLAWLVVGVAIGRSDAWIGAIAQAYLIMAFALFALLRMAYLHGKQAGLRSAAVDVLYKYEKPPGGPPRTLRRLRVVR